MAGALEKAFELSVVITAIDKISAPMKSMENAMKYSQTRMDSITKSMKAMGATSGEVEKVTASLNKLARVQEMDKIASDLQKIGMSKEDIALVAQGMERMAAAQTKMEKANKTVNNGMQLAGAGAVMTGGGIFGADLLVKSLEKAGEFQTKLVTIQDTTGATTDQMNQLGDSIMNVSTKVSKFNDMQLAGFAQKLSTSGFNNIQDVQNLMLPVSQFAEAQVYEGKQSDPNEAIRQATEMAHTFKIYDPGQFTQFLDTFNKYSNMQPGDSSALTQTLTYLAPVAQGQLKMQQSDIMALAAIDNRIGLTGSHGGTNSADMILRLIPGLVGGTTPKVTKDKNGNITSTTYPKALQAMMEMGLADANGNSKFFQNGQIVNLDQMLQTLIDAGKNLSPEKLTQDYKDIFGIQGGRAAALLADPSTLEQLQGMRTQLGQTKSMEQIQQDISKTPQGQLDLLKSNSMTASLRFAQALGPLLNPLLVQLNAMLGKFLQLEQEHPKLMKYVGLFAVMFTGLLLIAGPLTSLIGLFQMLRGGLAIFALTKEMGGLTRFGMALLRVGMVVFRFQGIITTALGGAMRFMGSFLIQAIAWAARMAVTWFVAMGPIGWIIGGVILVLGLLWLAWQKNWGNIRQHVADSIAWIKAHFMQILVAIGPAGWIVAGLVLLVKNWKTYWSDIVKFTEGIPDKMKTIGSDIVHGIWNGIQSLGSWISGNLTKWAEDNIPGPIKKALGINSPSRVMMQHGMFVAQGLAIGMMNGAKTVSNAATGLAGATYGAFSDAAPSLAGGGGDNHIHVYPHPNQNADQIADMVIQKLGRQSRRMNMNGGIRVARGT